VNGHEGRAGLDRTIGNKVEESPKIALRIATLDVVTMVG
jgi:hypothetical protein